MSLLLFYDTETSGMPLWKMPSDHEDQPHIVQLAAKTVDSNTRKTVQEFDFTIRPDGWKIDPEAEEVHGISELHAGLVGIAETSAVYSLLSLLGSCNRRVGYSEAFDARMLRIAIKRSFDDEEKVEVESDWWKGFPSECVMKMANPIVCSTSEKTGRKKYPKLNEAYEYFFNKPMEDAHTAMGDVDATIAVYFAIEDMLKK